MMSEHWIEWEGLMRLYEDAPLVRVYYEASGWVPYCPATWESPAEGGLFEDIFFIRAEVDPRDGDAAPLTVAEQAQAKAWFEAADWKLAESIQRIAEQETDRWRA